ncbi:MAG: hypothetical protein HC888_02505 [Candidatus Competibacteraceae bacterium]|nr:hypothetical protein [Candidatus Competibacteraceae bacterium]
MFVPNSNDGLDIDERLFERLPDGNLLLKGIRLTPDEETIAVGDTFFSDGLPENAWVNGEMYTHSDDIFELITGVVRVVYEKAEW